MVTDLIVVENSIVVFGGKIKDFSFLAADNYIVLQIILPVIITFFIAGVVFFPLFFYFLVNNYAIPGFVTLPADNLEKRDQHKHTADSQTDIQGLRIFQC